jgi:nicotinamidase-related amidase
MTFGQREVFIDLCIQREYLALDQPTRCRNADQVIANAKHVMAFARLTKTPVLSCVDVHCGNRIGADFVSVGSTGEPDQRKATFSLLPHRTVIQPDNCICMALDILQRHQQAIFTKIHRDPFTNPKLDRILTEMPVRRFVVFGVPLESSLRMLVLGLLRRKRRVVLLRDVCGYWNGQEADMVLRQLSVKGCEVASASQYLGAALARLARKLGRRIRPSRLVA